MTRRTPGVSVDWRVAATVGSKLAPPGPVAARPELEAVVHQLRSAAQRAVSHVVEVTAMTPADGRNLETAPLASIHVIDRPGWVRANTQVMERMLAAAAGARTGTLTHSDAVSELVGGAQVGAALSMFASKVLGQLDPYASADPQVGRLLLVAPNILAVESALNLNRGDFQLWVCLHEQTHALQFAAAPWLAQHMIERTGKLLDVMTGTGADQGKDGRPPNIVGRAVWNFVRAGREVAFMDRFLTPEQRREVADVGAVMALLEGHADVMMDDVGPKVVPTVARIRKAFDARRGEVRARDFVLRKLLGMDAKMAQYRDGARFVRAIQAAGGTELLNTVWTGPHSLPTAPEISTPALWLRRMGA